MRWPCGDGAFARQLGVHETERVWAAPDEISISVRRGRTRALSGALSRTLPPRKDTEKVVGGLQGGSKPPPGTKPASASVSDSPASRPCGVSQQPRPTNPGAHPSPRPRSPTRSLSHTRLGS
ncbi:hypothetical protein HJG60_008412 [Phyllostomus discolor]|uniref:Uncharacterized protein n=1 Tax=Phyllostomus discolor TaxID=89673 RepID=A0A834DNC0_9CHIR|nr:hypothetical protein HJG60_008412 [Phyllostomus discolor]